MEQRHKTACAATAEVVELQAKLAKAEEALSDLVGTATLVEAGAVHWRTGMTGALEKARAAFVAICGEVKP